MSSVSSKIQAIEALVRGGKFSEAKKCLREVRIRKLPRREALAFANLARRAGMGKLALRILNPIVRPESRRAAPGTASATEEEKIEYAACLRKLGAISEAVEILAKIDSRKHPEAGLHLAFCLIAEWRYDSAIPLLRSYIKSFNASSYEMNVAKINLLEALIHEQDQEAARGLIDELHREIDASRHSLLYLKTLDLAAQFEIFLSEDWDQAIRCLEKAELLLDRARDSVYALYIAKWFAIARSLKAGKITHELREARERALELEHWETVRDCDFYIARILRDRGALIRLYFGTPFESYREKIRKALAPNADLPGSFLWGQGRSADPEQVFDLPKAQSPGGRASLPPGQALHRLLILLCQDFYRPMPLVSLFSKLFTGEYYHPDSSPNRVYQIIFRLRRWARDNSVPLEVEEISGSFRLKFTGAFWISIPREPLSLTQRELEFLRLRLCLDQESFTTRDASRAIGMSRSAAKILLRWAVKSGKARLEGHTNRARYRLLT